MRGIVLRTRGVDPLVSELPVPTPGPGQVRVAMRACGICGSDLHIIEGSTVPPSLPLVLGHEPSGVVDALGPGVEDLALGTRVTVNTVLSCGQCRPCLRGQANICRQAAIMGLHLDGAHSDFFLAPRANVIPLPDSVGFATGAVVADAVGTPMRAIALAGITPGSTVAVYGLGGLGLHAAMILDQVYGAHVIGVDANDAALERAAGFGVAEVFDARAGRVSNRIAAATGGGVDAAFEFVGSVDVVEQAVRSLDHGGICVVVGLTPDRLTLTLRQESLVARGLRIVGSQGYLTADIVTLLDWIDSGRLRVEGTITHIVDLDDYADGLAALRDRSSGAIRVVVTTAAGGDLPSGSTSNNDTN